MQTTSIADLDAKLASLNATLSDTERAVDTLSLPAASGDARSIEKLTAARARIEQLRADRDVLERARAAATTQIDEAAKAEAARLRAEAKARAVSLAERLMQMAQRADAMAAEFRSMVETMPEVEADLWAALRKAGEEISDGTVGRRGLVRHAVAAVTSAPLPIRPRACADVAGVAWSCLLDTEI